MKHIIAGTAGHIDHGKTALVRALTGIETDRWEEEKRRGITIDLGFAHLQLTPDIRLGFVDVPGHERFVKNMLAGAGGIDLVLFVVAADESIKPQTREHFEICRLLGISRGIVVLTKTDMVDQDIVELVRLEVEEFTAGSFLEGAPIVSVSSTTGAGLNDLREQLRMAAAQVMAKDATRHFRLPIDRAFSMKGFGTVVTGTLISGSVAREQEVEIHPLGRRVRVRGIQVHGQQADRAFAGQRTALNLADIEPGELARGMMLTLPDLFRPIREFDCTIELIESAKPLRHRAPVHFHSGAAEIEAEVRLFESRPALKPGGRAYARIALREPALLLPADRFIIRSFSPVSTIGGGQVLDITGRRYRRIADAPGRLRILEQGSVRQLVKESRAGMSVGLLVAQTGMLAAEIECVAGLRRLHIPEPWLVDQEWFDQAVADIERSVSEFHRANPLLPGAPRQEIRRRDVPPPISDALLAASKLVVSEGEIVRLVSHRLVLKEDEKRARAAIEAAFEHAGLAAPSVVGVLASSGVEPGRARSLLQILIREKRLVRVNDELVFHESAMNELKRLLAERRSQRFGVPAFKDWTGVSRKYAIPLLEFLDRERITRRDGDERIVL